MKTLFRNLGLSEKETAAWLKMLELGAQPVSVIAKYVSVPRSSMYVILERLEKLQLIEHFDRNGITYFKCIAVRSLPELLQNQEEKIEHTLQVLHKKLPQLEALENKLSITPRVRFFEGKTGAAKMYKEVLKEKEFHAAFNPKLVKHAMPEYYYKVAEALKEKSGRAKELVLDCPEGREYQKRFHSENHQIKILPTDVDFPSDTIICKNKIYMISYGEGQISATEIVNPSLAQTQRALFEELWKRL